MVCSSQAVERWFGPGFAQLHPLLQQLHREGGTLCGRVHLAYGKGIAGWISRRIASKLGLSAASGDASLRINIHSDLNALHWSRAFNNGPPSVSVFTPAGSWPDGHWTERVGAIRLALGVDTSGGGWRWIQLGVWLWRVPLPRHLVPHLDASKRIVDGQYHFSVALSHPLLGLLFSYSGKLAQPPQN